MRKLLWLVAVVILNSCQEENVNSNVGDEAYPPEYYDNSNNTNDNADNGDNIPAPTYQTFYDQLSPYGTWVNNPTYGYMWVPNPVDGFSPYMSNGHWIYTDYGWTWVSDYDWGWAPFHYGRWFFDDGYGWMWQPGYDWAPAWVTWGDYGGYYCWAPIEPGVIISASYRPPVRYWYAVPHDKITQPGLVTHVMHNNVDIVSHVNIINNANTYKQAVFFSGPKAVEVQKYTGQQVSPVTIVNTPKPGKTQVTTDGKLNIYQPGIVRTRQQPTPAKVSQPENTRQSNGQAQPANVHTQPAPQRNIYTPPQRQNTPAPQRQPDRGFIPTPSYRPVQPQQQPRPSYQPQQQRPSFQPQSRPSYNPPSTPRGGGRR